MRRLTTVLVAMALFMGSLFGSQMTVRAEEAEKKETRLFQQPSYLMTVWEEMKKEESPSAYELCYSANSWEEYKAIFEQFECEQADIPGRTLKELPEKLSKLSTFWSMGILTTEEKADELEEAIKHAISLYNEQGNLTFSVSVTKRDFNGPNTEIDIRADKAMLTYLGNVVISANVPCYENIDAYREKREATYYQKLAVAYTCGVAYWNSDGTLEKIDYVPFVKVANLKDSEKRPIDTNFEGTTLVLLCTTDTILGWANLEELYQYEDACGNMEFYNSDAIKYYEEE